MASAGWWRFVGSFVVPAVGIPVVATLGSGVDVLEAALWSGIAVGLLAWSLVEVLVALFGPAPQAARRRVPRAALAVLVTPVPVVCWAAGFWVALGTSDAAGTVMSWAALSGLACAALTVVTALLLPHRRGLATALCAAAVLVPVVVGGAMAFYVARVDARLASAAADFPSEGESRPAQPDEPASESSPEGPPEALRVWDESDVTCPELSDRFERWSGRPAVESAAIEGEACAVEAEASWTGWRAAVRADGRFVSVVWSPTADLFVF